MLRQKLYLIGSPYRSYLRENLMAFNMFQIVVGLIVATLGYQIAKQTQSDAIALMGWIVTVLGIVLTAAGIGIIPFPYFAS